MSNSKPTIAIGALGGGGQADELEDYLSRTGSLMAFRALSSEYIDPKNPNHIDILVPNDEQRNCGVVAAVGAPYLRRQLIDQWPGSKYATVVSENVYISESAKIGEGTIIAPGVVITTSVYIGKHSLINVSATISHNCKLGDYSTIGPGVHLAGNVTLGDGVFVGMGACIKNGVTLASGVVIGAGAVVLNDVTVENAVYAGVPAREINQNKSWLQVVD